MVKQPESFPTPVWSFFWIDSNGEAHEQTVTGPISMAFTRWAVSNPERVDVVELAIIRLDF